MSTPGDPYDPSLPVDFRSDPDFKPAGIFAMSEEEVQRLMAGDPGVVASDTVGALAEYLASRTG
jgi:hypothetical protein